MNQNMTTSFGMCSASNHSANGSHKLSVLFAPGSLFAGGEETGLVESHDLSRQNVDLGQICDLLLDQVREFKTLLDCHAVVVTTDPEGRITHVNSRFCEISKYAREELLGQDLRILNSGYHDRT